MKKVALYALCILLLPLWLLLKLLRSIAVSYAYWRKRKKPRWRILGLLRGFVFFEEL